MKMTAKELQHAIDVIEPIIDKHSIDEVLDTIELICYEKAMHIRENWQDEKLAASWDTMGNKINTFIERLRYPISHRY